MDGSTRSENQYVTETNQLYNCDVELLSGIKNDPRYTVQYESSEGKSFQIREWEVMGENGVAELLNRMPDFDSFTKEDQL